MGRRVCGLRTVTAALIGSHTFRTLGIMAYHSNGGALEHAQEMADSDCRSWQG
jgi:hypothetical protein